MVSKRGRTSANGASPRKRQKSVNGQAEVVEFVTRVVLDPANDKAKSKEETEPEPLLGELDEHLDHASYTVKPAVWNTLKKYKRFSIMNETFQVGDCILVKAGETMDDSALPDNLKERWVGKVLECRAFDEQAVYIRLVWFQRPEDLPGGRKFWHGTNELIASNDPQIIDANTVDGKVEVHQWDEDNDDVDLNDGELFWRQSYDMSKKPPVYSGLRAQCICSKPGNPDKLLIRCENPKCAKWLHEECLIEDLAVSVLGGGSPDTKGSVTGTPQSQTKAKNTKGRKKEAASGKPFTMERLVVAGSKPERLPSAFQITPTDKSRPAFTVQLNDTSNGGDTVYSFLSTDMPGHSKKDPFVQEIKCLSCKTVID